MMDLWADIIRTERMQALLVCAEQALAQATDEALAASKAKLVPNPDSATDTPLMNRLRRLTREVYELRMSGGAITTTRLNQEIGLTQKKS